MITKSSIALLMIIPLAFGAGMITQQITEDSITAELRIPSKPYQRYTITVPRSFGVADINIVVTDDTQPLLYTAAPTKLWLTQKTVGGDLAYADASSCLQPYLYKNDPLIAANLHRYDNPVDNPGSFDEYGRNKYLKAVGAIR